MHTEHASELAEVRALMSAMDDLAGVYGAAESAQWGDSGLGAPVVEISDFINLARLHHRLSAQLGRWIVESAVSRPAADLTGRSGPLIDFQTPGQAPPKSAVGEGEVPLGEGNGHKLAAQPHAGFGSVGCPKVPQGIASETDLAAAPSEPPGPAGLAGSVGPSYGTGPVGPAESPDHEASADSESASMPTGSADVNPASDFSRRGLPFGAQATLVASAWTPSQAGTLVAAARFASRHPRLNRLWSEGQISAEMVREMARVCRTLTDSQVADFLAIMVDNLPGLNYQQVRRLAGRVIDLVKPADLDKDEERAHAKRSLTFIHYLDTVIFQGRLPKMEGQLFADAVAAMAEKQRSEGDGLSMAQRQADALTELIVAASSSGSVPTLGGLPVGITLTMNASAAESVAHGDSAEEMSGTGEGLWAWGVSGIGGGNPSGAGSQFGAGSGFGGDKGLREVDRVSLPNRLRDRATFPDGALAAPSVARFALCAGAITPIKVCTCNDHNPILTKESEELNSGPYRGRPLQTRLIESPTLPLSVGRTQRLATTAQRKAMALRDGGCVISGCSLPPNRTQAHHVTDFSLGGLTDMENLASLCWTHHRQVDLGHWELVRRAEIPTHVEDGPQPYWVATPVFIGKSIRPRRAA